MIDKDVIEKIRQQSDIVEVISDFVNLKRHGNTWKAPCPFLDHMDSKPSFSVSQSKQFYKCFGCGRGGNVFSFLMQYQGLSFVEAVQALAAKYGIELVYTNEENRGLLDYLYDIHRRAFEFFCELGKQQGFEFFISRKVSEESIAQFGLGFCRDFYEQVKDDYSSEVIEESGLFFTLGFSIIDVHQNRFTIPLIDLNERCIGFASTGSGVDPKYRNPVDTSIYGKSGFLYGLPYARKSIHDKQYVIVVEGYFDCIMMHQYGFTNTVAICGTTLTSLQAKLLSRYTDKVLLFLDGDEAGLKAVDTNFVQLYQHGVQMFVCDCPDREDPDSLLQQDKSIVVRILKEAIGWFDKRFEKVTKYNRFELSQLASSIGSQIEEESKVSLFLDICAGYLGVDQKSLLQKRVIYSSRPTDCDQFFKKYEFECAFFAAVLSTESNDFDESVRELFLLDKDLLCLYDAIVNNGDSDISRMYDRLSVSQSMILTKLKSVGDLTYVPVQEALDVLRQSRQGQLKQKLLEDIRKAANNGDVDVELIAQRRAILFN